MDERNDEQTELLRHIWNQIKDLDHSLGRRIDKTNEVVAELKIEMVEVKCEIREMKGDISEMKGDISEMKGDISEMKGDISEMKGDISEMKGDIKGLRADVDELKLETKAIRVATQDGFAMLARADARQTSDLGDLRTRVERIEEHVGLR